MNSYAKTNDSIDNYTCLFFNMLSLQCMMKQIYLSPNMFLLLILDYQNLFLLFRFLLFYFQPCHFNQPPLHRTFHILLIYARPTLPSPTRKCIVCCMFCIAITSVMNQNEVHRCAFATLWTLKGCRRRNQCPCIFS